MGIVVFSHSPFHYLPSGCVTKGPNPSARAFDYTFYVPLEVAKEVIEGKKASAKMSLLVADGRENV